MMFALGAREEFADVVIGESRAETEGASLRAVSHRGWRSENAVEPHSERGVDHFLKGLPQLGSAFSRLHRDIGIQRQGGSHLSIMMFNKRKSTHHPAAQMNTDFTDYEERLPQRGASS